MADEAGATYDRGVRGLPSLRSLIVASVVGLAAACGGSSDAVAPATETPTPATPTPTATATPDPTPTATAPPVEPTATTGALSLEELPLIEFVRSDGTVVAFPVEVPPRTEYGIGLSGRYELSERGMLFHYPDAGTARGFYMRNTHIDLDIAFLGADFVIQEIFRMDAESLEIRRPAEPYQYAVEAPAGWYAANGVAMGDMARFTFTLP